MGLDPRTPRCSSTGTPTPPTGLQPSSLTFSRTEHDRSLPLDNAKLKHPPTPNPSSKDSLSRPSVPSTLNQRSSPPSSPHSPPSPPPHPPSTQPATSPPQP